MNTPSEAQIKKAYIDLVTKRCPVGIDLSGTHLIFHGVYDEAMLRSMKARGESSYQGTAMNTYWKTVGKFNHVDFVNFQAAHDHTTEFVVFNAKHTAVKMGLVADTNSHDMVAEIYMSVDWKLYGIAYHQPYRVQAGVIDPATLALLLPLAAYAKKKNEDCGELFYHSANNAVWVVGDDGMRSKHMEKLREQAEQAGFSIDIEAECEPTEEGWLYVEPNGTVTVHRVID